MEDGQITQRQYLDAIAPETYGIAFSRHVAPWFITGARCEHARGIYRGDKLVVPNVCGTGLAFLHNGDLLVVEYGRHYPGAIKGRSCRIKIVPREMLQ
ncbi:MAG: hypothetical protein COT81_01840 [Candidatus Buchananbacteria bacterium CG10_big_fil_rev_8_21_14_0_10_42_9]|uniref:Uncharacterized protein n=1 Tax=Candidatus Buchananbacteria bacterium CG10_big_fil_rev_8_21_14_0_10_42_9 TaxID=1974526 RepID=A0A2H0W415_9BACT|nr:MAG: hypothetical protein COT81_01840 [Candidatus Buchananbacteria bacterium CG10_big_fil_rev_8_21_14_0_10_42_9]